MALAKELGLGGVGVFTGENAGGDEEYWKALTGINSRPRLKSDDGGERQPQDESCEADAAEEAGAGAKPSRAEELLVAALRQDQAAWKPGRAVSSEFWVEALPECGEGQRCPTPGHFCCAVDFPTGIAGKKYRDGMCCEKTPTTCATRSPHVKACLMCNRYYDWATDAADECKWDKCVLAVSAGRAVELAEAHPPP